MGTDFLHTHWNRYTSCVSSTDTGYSNGSNSARKQQDVTYLQA